MKIVCITGGMGSGKSKVMEFFAAKGHPCYQADTAGRRLLTENEAVIMAIKKTFGTKVFTPSDTIDRQKLAEIVFKDAALLAKLNAIIHPAVAEDFKLFLKTNQQAALVFKEAAILIESGGYKQCDTVLLVTSPKNMRLERITARDAISEAAINQRMENQWEDTKKMPFADFVVTNTDWEETLQQLEPIYEQLKVGVV